eukprot:202657_1
MTKKLYAFKDVKGMSKLYLKYRKEIMDNCSDKIKLKNNPLIIPVDYRKNPPHWGKDLNFAADNEEKKQNDNELSLGCDKLEDNIDEQKQFEKNWDFVAKALGIECFDDEEFDNDNINNELDVHTMNLTVTPSLPFVENKNNDKDKHNDVQISAYENFETELRSSFHERMDSIGETRKYIVNGFIRDLQKISGSNISLGIFCFIYLYYGSVYDIQESFTKYTEGMISSNNNMTLANSTGNPCTAYGTVDIGCEDTGTHVWKIKIDKLSEKCIVGIDCADKNCTNVTERNSGTFHGMDSFGETYGNVSHCVSEGFDVGDVLTVLYNTVTRRLRIEDENKQYMLMTVIGTTKKYHITITIHGQNDQLTVEEYNFKQITKVQRKDETKTFVLDSKKKKKNKAINKPRDNDIIYPDENEHKNDEFAQYVESYALRNPKKDIHTSKILTWCDIFGEEPNSSNIFDLSLCGTRKKHRTNARQQEIDLLFYDSDEDNVIDPLID